MSSTEAKMLAIQYQINKTKHSLNKLINSKEQNKIEIAILDGLLKAYTKTFNNLNKQLNKKMQNDLNKISESNDPFDINKKLSGRLKAEAQFISQQTKWGEIISPYSVQYKEANENEKDSKYCSIDKVKKAKILPHNF